MCSSASRRTAVPVARNSVACSPQTRFLISMPTEPTNDYLADEDGFLVIPAVGPVNGEVVQTPRYADQW